MKLQGLFITPVFTMDIENDYNLVEKLYDLKKRDAVGSPKSNIRGWHSKEDLYEHEDFKQITQDILYHSQQCFHALSVEKKYSPELTGLWGMINPPGARNSVHTHPLNYLSGVLYLKVPKNSGNLVFIEPRPQAEVFDPPKKSDLLPNLAHTVQWEAKEKNLIFFPSWLQHEVQQNNSNQDRVIMSFNLRWRV
jgi:uncharacterized protein (TIGR02466 family)|tara:strand:+ start:397 stop:975 length:579 start_codon:yes stop_codon:yes gene_type:complete